MDENSGRLKHGESQRGKKLNWNKSDRLKVIILVDVDGTLVSPYRAGKRELRSSAPKALELLSSHAPLFLWSIAGVENGLRLLKEFSQLRSLVSGCYGKDEFPLHLIDNPYCIDDEQVDDVVLQCNHVIVDTFQGGMDSNDLLEAAQIVIRHITDKGLFNNP